MELCPLKKITVFFFEWESINGQITRHGDIDEQFGDIGIDVPLADATCHRNAVIAIAHKVDVADFVDVDRRQINVLQSRFVDIHPAFTGVVRFGEEVTVKIAIPPFATDYIVERDGL